MNYKEIISIIILIIPLHATINAIPFQSCCRDEAIMMSRRLPRMEEALSRFINTPDIDPTFFPNIGVAVSGGGWVAAIAELGLLQGLEAIGLLDGIASIATSSGSTWTLSTWLQHASLTDVETYLRPRLEAGFNFDKQTIEDLIKTAQLRHNQGLAFDITAVWGEALTRQFLDHDDDCSTVHSLHNSIEALLNGNYPLPLFTSIIKPQVSLCESTASVFTRRPSPEHEWLEYSPFITRLNGKNTYKIPTPALGVSWNYLLGTWGSAYAFDFADGLGLINEMITGTWGYGLSNIINPLRRWLPKTNFLAPEIPNFMINSDNAFSGQKTLRPVDSGIDLKVPFPPLFDRNTNIIIVCDVSSDRLYKNGQHSLEQAMTYAKKHNIPFPNITDKSIFTGKNTARVIIDDDAPDAPIIIYLASTSEETMTPMNDQEKFTRIRDEMMNLVVKNKDVFRKTITFSARRSAQG